MTLFQPKIKKIKELKINGWEIWANNSLSLLYSGFKKYFFIFLTLKKIYHWSIKKNKNSFLEWLLKALLMTCKMCFCSTGYPN